MNHSNFLITYSPYDDYGFENIIYKLENSTISLENIEQHLNVVVLIPYDFKNKIEPKCFSPKTNKKIPIILPIIEKQKWSSKLEIENFLSEYKTSFEEIKNDKVLKHTISFEEYYSNFLIIQKYLHLGDIYEINYCIPFVFENITIPIEQLFLEAIHKMQSPFTALFKYQDYYILSFSPERFLKKEGNKLFTEPIKGTAPRGITVEEDNLIKHQLQQNPKERTENAMIVDVCRNDLSRIAQKASVKIEELFTIKSYPTVHQMVSKISCNLKENITFKDIIYATFPMASMTGAPKIRSMQIADEIEKYPREYYSGCLGIYENGNFDLSVLIRSMFYDKQNRILKIWAGSAITIYADPYQEYKECLLKAEKIIQLVEKFTTPSKNMT